MYINGNRAIVPQAEIDLGFGWGWSRVRVSHWRRKWKHLHLFVLLYLAQIVVVYIIDYRRWRRSRYRGPHWHPSSLPLKSAIYQQPEPVLHTLFTFSSLQGSLCVTRKAMIQIGSNKKVSSFITTYHFLQSHKTAYQDVISSWKALKYQEQTLYVSTKPFCQLL